MANNKTECTHVLSFEFRSIIDSIAVFGFGWWCPADISCINPFQFGQDFVAEVNKPAECQSLSNVIDTGVLN